MNKNMIEYSDKKSENSKKQNERERKTTCSLEFTFGR